MELIPILSTIILVATISTFLLAIGAYILYKVREAKGTKVSAPAPGAVKAELVTPGEAPAQQQEQVRVQQPVFVETEPLRVRQPLFVQQYRSNPAPKWQATQPRQYSSSYQQRGYEAKSAEDKSDKFYKYTNEGYVTPREDKEKSGALRWR